MKKLLILLLALLLLVGCTPAANTTTTQQPTTTAPQPTVVPTTVPETTVPENTPPITFPQPTEPEINGCGGHETDPYEGVTKDEFYADYEVACCYIDAQYRSQHGLLSGLLELSDGTVPHADYQPMYGEQYIHFVENFYTDDGNTYIIVDGYGNEVLRIHRGGGYISLNEVAAYMYAFGGSAESLPANYSANKKADPDDSIWGEYLRLNHTNFKFNPSKYPYEPALPNILGDGDGKLQYYEMDIGGDGYNDGSRISRGMLRLVYARKDLNGNGIYETDEVYVFFTHNHYHDFTEYLNYYGGWGETFGNHTGGGTGNPTPYVPVVYDDLSSDQEAA